MERFLPTVDTANRPWTTSVVAPRRAFLGRAARGPVAPRKMACRPAAGAISAVQGHQRAHRGGAAWSLPLSIGGENGRQVARPRFAFLPVAVLRSLRLGG